MIRDAVKGLWARVANDEYRYYFQWCVLCVLLGAISLAMCIMNIVTHKPVMVWVTGAFALISFADFIVLRVYHRQNMISTCTFCVATGLLFVYFLVTGGANAFSPHWILLLPAFGMMFLGMKKGAIFELVMLAVVLFLLWTPLGCSLLTCEYSKEFHMRFPVVYAAFLCVGFCFEAVRASTYRHLMEAQTRLSEIAETDTLTQIHNRYWFDKKYKARFSAHAQGQECAMLLVDIDDFKRVNDRYGHEKGDEVLIAVAQTIAGQLRSNDMLCRWGGEEFLGFVTGVNKTAVRRISDRLHGKLRSLEFHVEDPEIHDRLRITVSIGIALIEASSNMRAESLFAATDKAAYAAKDAGKNCTVLTMYRENETEPYMESRISES